MRAAKRLGIPVSFPVRSWDNLTNKGLLRDAPDQVLVWNDLQKREAVELHGVEPESVVVTGAPAYDHWFDWQPSRTRDELCAAAGLDPAHPLVLYVGSSEFIAPDEPRFVRRWVEAVRARGGTLARAGLLVRPHPLAASGLPRPADRRRAGRDLAGARRVSVGRGGAAELLRLDLPLRSRGRDQHQRADRGGDRGPAGVHDPRRPVRRHPGRNAPLPLPRRRPVRAPARRRHPRGARRAAGAGRRRRGTERSERALPAQVRPTLRARRGGDRAGRRRGRRACGARAVAARTGSALPGRSFGSGSGRWRRGRRRSGGGRSRRGRGWSRRRS